MKIFRICRLILNQDLDLSIALRGGPVMGVLMLSVAFYTLRLVIVTYVPVFALTFYSSRLG